MQPTPVRPDTRAEPWVELLVKVLAGVPRLPGRAACREHVSVFDLAADGHREAAEEAVAVCESCPVIDACRSWITAARRPPPGVTAGKYTPTKSQRKAEKHD
jgi:hypothetical protein